MKLAEALSLVNESRQASGSGLRVGLACGFTPLHLETFLHAHLLRARPDLRFEIHTPLYGDLVHGAGQLAGSGLDGVAVVVEWADLDPRLGLRRLGGWGPSLDASLVETAARRLAALHEALAALGRETRVALAGPTLPLPPAFHTPTWQAGGAEALLRQRVAEFAAACAGEPGLVVLASQALDAGSPPGERHDVRSELRSDFPYSRSHAAALGAALARALQPPAPLKGLITDLDDTLWRGLVGEVGADGVHFDLDRRSHVHALYQQLLQSAAEAGVLLAVASKNAPEVAERALAREDLRLGRERLFPVAAGWGPKSEMVERILESWNVGADAVAFVDDSAMELAEVAERFPGIHTFRFPAEDDAAALALLRELRDRLGRGSVGADDALRLESLRSGAGFRSEAGASDPEAFLAGLEAEVGLDFRRPPPDARPLELVNKTNQFNLNGRRLGEAEWQRRLGDAGRFLLVASYTDRFGPLGRIAVLEGELRDDRAIVKTWVMSCRAFARRIEYACLDALFERFGVERVELEYDETPRNAPVLDFLATLVDEPKPGPIRIDADVYRARRPELHCGVRSDG